jgi:hypothetical protein
MAIDNVYDAIDKQNPEEGDGVVSSITRAFDGAKALGIPIPEPITAFFSVLDSMSREAREQRGIAFIRQLVEDMQKVQGDVAKAVSINKGCNCILTEVHSLLDEEWRGFPAAKVRQRVAAS